MLFDNKWKQLHNEHISLYKNLTRYSDSSNKHF